MVCKSLYTYEIDDCDLALSEMNNQLKQMALEKNTIGIIMCHPEFVWSGTYKYICDNLPFDIAGVTTSSQVVNETAGEMILTLFVMTSDDVIFKSGVTECLEEDYVEPTKAAYTKVSAGMEEPKLALIFPPLILKYAGDVYPNLWSEILPRTPNFGTIAIDDTVTFANSETLYNGNSYKTCMPFVLCYGNIAPRFMIGTLPESSSMPYKGEVTISDGPYVKEINNANAYTYFENIGFAKDGSPSDNFLFIPFLIDQRSKSDYDSIPVMRVLATFEQDGTAIFRGAVEKDSIFTLLKCTSDDVVSTTESRVKQFNELDNVNGVLSFSCIIRRMVMDSNTMRELEAYKDSINPNIPFMMGYAGGEICPTSFKNNRAANRFHNYSLISLIV